MKKTTKNVLEDLVRRYPILESCYADVCLAVEMLITCYKTGHKILVCGNGGSAADSEHIVGELMKGFILPRKLDVLLQDKIKNKFPKTAEYLSENLQGALPAISLVNQTALNTAFANDQAADLVFAQQILGLGKGGDILLAISTSGNSQNVLYAAQIAIVKGIKIIGLTGKSGGDLEKLADSCIMAPTEETYQVQEYHLPIYHAICLALEEEIFGELEI